MGGLVVVCMARTGSSRGAHFGRQSRFCFCFCPILSGLDDGVLEFLHFGADLKSCDP
jgi:hypothetical protein